MANYYGAIRSNYFRVKNEEEFKKLIDNVTAEDEVYVFNETSNTGEKLFGFGCNGSIYGLCSEDEDCELDYDDFVRELQDVVAEDDAIIIMEAGHEKLRYIVGTALVVTSSDAYLVDATTEAKKKAREFLGNPNWETRTEY